MTKEKKKRRRLKIVFTITAICTIFSLLTISVFAYQQGTPYVPNVYSGNYSYAYHPLTRLSYITQSSSSKYYVKDIPISNVISAYGSTKWNGYGEPLSSGATNAQIIFSNEVANALFNPSVRSSNTYRFNSLGDDYSLYYQGSPQLDMNRYFITTKTGAGNDNIPYQRVMIRFSDTYLPNLSALDGDEMRVIYPQVRAYKPQAFGSPLYTLRCSVTAKSSVTDNIIYHTVSLNDIPMGESVGQGVINDVNCNIYAVNLYTVIRDSCIEANPEFANTYYWYITSFEVVVGKQSFDLSNISTGINGVIACDLYLPSIRPFNSDKVNSEDKYWDMSQPSTFDVNFVRNNNGAYSFGGADGSYDVPISSFGSFIANTTSGFLETSIMPGISLGGILFTVLAIMFVVCVLRYFAGG